MAPGPFGDPFATTHGVALQALAARSIRHGLTHGVPYAPDLVTAAAEWRSPRATFVTLEVKGGLRGCIGSILPRRPLAQDVSENAFAAAFRDTRFPPVTERECVEIDISISLLGPLSPIPARDDAGLLAQLRPHVDGLLIVDNDRRAVFLPQVWDQLPQPRDFLAALKCKGGFPDQSWSSGFLAQRFVVSEIPAKPLSELN